MPIDCSGCNGACCRHVVESLDRGDGTCLYFDETQHNCSIYGHRPLICDSDRMYEKYYRDVMTFDEYSDLNRQACLIIRQKQSENIQHERKRNYTRGDSKD